MEYVCKKKKRVVRIGSPVLAEGNHPDGTERLQRRPVGIKGYKHRYGSKRKRKEHYLSALS